MILCSCCFLCGLQSSVDNLFTPRCIHASPDYDLWENLGKYKPKVAVGIGKDMRLYSVHISNQEGSFPGNYGISAIVTHWYSHWKGAVLVLRTMADGEPMNCHSEDVLYVRELLARYDHFLL